MAISNIDFQLTYNYDYGVPCKNVFFYRKTTAHAANDAENLCRAFNGTMMGPITGIQNTIVVPNELEAINLTDLTDYFVLETTATNGSVASTSPAPTFTAYNIRLNRSTRQGRNGYKRFAGVAEELVSFSSTTISGALIGAMPALVAAIQSSISFGGATFVPRIPYRQLTTLPDGTQKYILTDLLDISTAEFRGLTTQNTRKG
jgi:hypothetical protein